MEFSVVSEPGWQKNFTVEAQKISTGNSVSVTTQIHSAAIGPRCNFICSTPD